MLTDLLTPDQARALAEHLAATLRHGYGQVAIIVTDGKVRFVEVTHSHRLPVVSEGRENGVQPARLLARKRGYPIQAR